MIAALVVPGPVTRDGARAAARAELSKRVYHRYDDPLPVRILKAVVRWIDHALSTTAHHSPGGPAGAIALVAVAVALVAVARWRLGPVRRNARVPGPVLAQSRLRAADHREAARLAADSGDWHTAVVEGMRATARALEEAGVVDPRPGRTADELAADAVDLDAETRAALLQAAHVFDAVAYGDRPATAASYEVIAVADRSVAHSPRRSVLVR